MKVKISNISLNKKSVHFHFKRNKLTNKRIQYSKHNSQINILVMLTINNHIRNIKNKILLELT